MSDSKLPNAASELAGLTAIVTGSSSGIGRAMALELASAGADCLVHGSRNREGAESVAAQIRALGRRADVLLTDLSQAAEQERFAEQAWQWQGKVDIWINNAGADTLTGAAAKRSFEQKLEALWRVDVAATIGLSRFIGAKMKERGQGVILNIGWDQAEQGMAGDSGELFAAAKGAVMAFTRSLSRSLAPEVRVNCLAAGWIKTKWADQASTYWQERAASESLLGRWGTPDDVARAARFLVSPAAAFINGQVIAINGGTK
ncbi:MAG TPA: SDR family oxidoreductase [Pirellulales bacterium]|jgi:3-oxoacyl-[acyl-carrier protein] reductase|nr:SDR family oxidoreductase [Pirellulales bacterium]